METICIKMDKNLLKNIDDGLKKHNYSTRSEFLRAAVREKLDNMNQEQLTKEFMKFYGSAKKKTTDEENRRTREEVSKELMKELDKRFR